MNTSATGVKGASGVSVRKEAEVVVVGAGIAGLTAAWQLRDKDVVVLEKSDRVGGRMMSKRSGPYWLNFGAHLFPGRETIVGRLADELSLELVRVPDLMAVALNGKIVDGPASILAAVRTLGWRDRVRLGALGARLLRGVGGYHREVRRAASESTSQARLLRLSYRDDQTLAAYLGLDSKRERLADELVRAATHRSGAEPDEMSAGAGLSLFAHVWAGARSVTARNMVGGSERLGRALAQGLGGRVRNGASVESVAQSERGLTVTYSESGASRVLEAPQVIMAVPPAEVLSTAIGLPTSTSAALSRMRFGNYVCLGMFTNETKPAPWDSHYAIATPGMAFDLFVNDARVLRHGDVREPGGAIRVVAGGRNASRLDTLSDDEVFERLALDLDRLFPGASGLVGSRFVQRWSDGNAYAAPGRAALQADVEAPLLDDRLHLAGDFFVEDSSMDGAAEAGLQAAQRVRSMLPDARGIAVR